MARGDNRREPTFGDAPDRGGLRADPRDRPAPPRGRKRGREPEDDDFDDDPPPRRRGKNAGSGAARRAPSRSFLGAALYWAMVLGLWGAVGVAGLFIYYGAQLPPIDKLAVPRRPPNIAIMSATGELLANRGDTGGAAVRVADLPAYLPKAFIAIEDRRFYSHWGVDPYGVARALTRNLTGGATMQGGSTLTQQLAKNLFLTQERTISRKIQEAILALWLEHKYSKEQILELYLNRVYFGSGAYGVEAASQRYFGHSARAATLSESAVLAGLMKAPSKLAPDRNPKGATERAAQVIAAMKQEGFISDAMTTISLAHPAQARVDQGAGSINYAADFVMDQLAETVGAIDEDIVVTTTLDPALQSAAERALTETLDKKGAKYAVTQGAIVAMEPTGAVRALIGGKDYGESQFNRATTARRQPGSAFKPFVYLAGLEHGLTPDTVREDGPLNVKGWQPENYSREYFGPVTLTKALSLSLNTVAVRVGLEAGPKAVVRVAHRLGVNSELAANASIALGTSEVSPFELVSAYAPFANGGLGVQPHVILKVRTAGGKPLFARKGVTDARVIEPRYVGMMNEMMEETLLTGTARKAELPGWQAAGKTGTSQDFRDAWFVGYTARLVAGVWIGNDDNSPTKKASGGNLPVEIWSRFMSVAHRGQQPEPLPDGEGAAAVASAAPQSLDGLFGMLTSRAPAPAPAPRAAPAPRPKPAPVAAPARELDDADVQDDAPAPPPSRPALSQAPATPPAPSQRARPAAAAAADPGLVPPEDIPEPRAARRPAPRNTPRDDKNLFDRLFGN